MSTFTLLLIFLTLAAATAAALVQTTGRAGYAPLKMLAASGYLAFALHQGALDSGYGQAILAGVLLSWLGDLCLLGDARRPFLAGLGAFLLAHVAYAVAFALRGVDPLPAALAGAGMVAVAVVVLRWLASAELPRKMRRPVGAYLVAIGVMVALAVGTGRLVVAAGAVAFAASDILVVRQRFVAAAPVNRRVGLPLYFAAQLLIASSV